MPNVTVQQIKLIKDNYQQYLWSTEDPSLTEVYLGSVEESYLIINKNADDQSLVIERYILNDGEQDVRADIEFLADSVEAKALDELITLVLSKLKDPAFTQQQERNFTSLANNSTALINQFFS